MHTSNGIPRDIRKTEKHGWHDFTIANETKVNENIWGCKIVLGGGYEPYKSMKWLIVNPDDLKDSYPYEWKDSGIHTTNIYAEDTIAVGAWGEKTGFGGFFYSGGLASFPRIRCRELEVSGSITANDKNGYVTDRFVNQSGDTIEQGDVVVFGRKSVKVYYGKDDNIPVPEIDLTEKAYDHRVSGVVSEILVEEELVPHEEAKTKASSKSKRKHDDGIKRLQTFSTKELEKLDRKKIDIGQIGKMVTLGCFAHCKVDADIAPIEVGDLLTTSPTKGHAQKVLEPEKATGAIIGKALGSLDIGKGKIPLLVMLQ